MIVLEIEDPSGERRIVHVSAESALIGRGRECLVQLEHETVSKKHAEILKQGQNFVIRDLESYNGTYVNGRWVTETKLRYKDRIGIGRYHLTFLSKVLTAPKRRRR